MTRKLIEVALPLEAISTASRRDKDRKTGTIKNVHKWFAPMPTPAWRALLFSAIVDDPGEGPEREALLDLVVKLVPEDGTAPAQVVLDEAHDVLLRSGALPTVVDPFCGGGSTIVEALRLGLPATGSDLNPVPVLITKVMCELIPAVAGRPSVSASNELPGTSEPLAGLLEDLRHYGGRVKDFALARIGHSYPDAPGGGSTVAWLWARTVTCPNPVCGAVIPLYSSPWISKKRGDERWLQPIVSGTSVSFEIRSGRSDSAASTKVGSRGGRFKCLVCGEITAEPHIRAEGSAGRLGAQLMAVVVDRPGSGRVFEPATGAQEAPGLNAAPPDDVPDVELVGKATVNVGLYGQRTQADLYLNRQLSMLGAFADGVAQVSGWIQEDGGDKDYAVTVASVLGLCIGRLAMANSTQVRWRTREGPAKAEPAFGRHALPMLWDFAEANPFGQSVGSWTQIVEALGSALRLVPLSGVRATVWQHDARTAASLAEPNSALVATDPPYFAYISYADLSDYFYVWHRRALSRVLPDLYGTVATPKHDELIASPSRHGGDTQAAYDFYVDGYTTAFGELMRAQRSDLPMIVVYAHKQEESDADEQTSAGWDAMLEALLAGGLGIVGTWPIHATSTSRQIGQGSNALASYVVLVCRPRSIDAGITDRQGFVRALRAELPAAIRALQAADTLPFDLTQAAIGPGMAIYSRFARIVEPDGEAMRVRSAIALINQVRSAVLSEQDDEFDAETRWAIQWFERYGFDLGPYGEAEKLFTATATSLEGLRRTGIIGSKAPDVWLLDPVALPSDWDPVTDLKTCTWEVTMHLLRALHHAGGEAEAARLLSKVDHFGDLARDLAYRLADICEATKRATTALAVNGLIAAWPEISRQAAMAPTPSQESLL